MAGVAGVEPTHTVPETAVLPLYDTPIALKPNALHRLATISNASEYITFQPALSQALSCRIWRYSLKYSAFGSEGRPAPRRLGPMRFGDDACNCISFHLRMLSCIRYLFKKC